MNLSRSVLFVVATACLLLAPIQTISQIIAGTLPSGAFAFAPGITLTIAPSSGSDTVELDLDCDGISDMSLELAMGDSTQPTLNRIMIVERDSNVAVCGAEIPISPPLVYTARLYDPGDPLICNFPNVMALDGEILIGAWGSGPSGGIFPSEEMDEYLYWSKGTQEGWIKLSFDIDSYSDTIWVEVEEILRYCVTTSTVAPSHEAPSIFPNPSWDGILKIHSSERVIAFAVYSMKGVKLQEGRELPDQLVIPSEAGIYLIHLWTDDGRSLTEKAVIR